jgi:predicted nucleic acid-binding protein
MILVVNDANILIDIIKLNLLPQFFGLELKFYTTSFVLYELHDDQQQALEEFINNEVLIIEELDQEDIEMLFTLQEERPQLSEQDCSAICCAQKLNATLLTSDKNLRQFAVAKKVAVHGHLWVLDTLVKEKQITGHEAIGALQRLREEINPKLGLTINLCQPFLDSWLKKINKK